MVSKAICHLAMTSKVRSIQWFIGSHMTHMTNIKRLEHEVNHVSYLCVVDLMFRDEIVDHALLLIFIN